MKAMKIHNHTPPLFKRAKIWYTWISNIKDNVWILELKLCSFWKKIHIDIPWLKLSFFSCLFTSYESIRFGSMCLLRLTLSHSLAQCPGARFLQNLHGSLDNFECILTVWCQNYFHLSDAFLYRHRADTQRHWPTQNKGETLTKVRPWFHAGEFCKVKLIDWFLLCPPSLP